MMVAIFRIEQYSKLIQHRMTSKFVHSKNFTFQYRRAKCLHNTNGSRLFVKGRINSVYTHFFHIYLYLPRYKKRASKTNDYVNVPL